MIFAQITVIVLTLNEEVNLARTLEALQAFPRVVILDSGSTDRTLEIARQFPNVEIHSRPFDTHACQWNHALLACGAQSDWMLALDADYVLKPEFLREIAALDPEPEVSGYRARFRYCVRGRPLTASLYPPVTVLYRSKGAAYEQDGHAQRLMLNGSVRELRSRIWHDDRKPLSSWLGAQDRYARLEADHLRSAAWGSLSWRDRLRRLCFIAPWLVPAYCLVLRAGILDGRHGFIYALERGIAEALLSLRLLEAAITPRKEQ